jgi:hypothetical protein
MNLTAYLVSEKKGTLSENTISNKKINTHYFATKIRVFVVGEGAWWIMIKNVLGRWNGEISKERKCGQAIPRYLT